MSTIARRRFLQGASHILPLCVAVLPWGLLAGSMAINNGFTPVQGVGLSVFMLAGAAQLVTISMFAAGSGTLAILLTIFIITAQHLLYGLILRDHIKTLPFKKRAAVGFLLTDELFATVARQRRLNFSYMMGAGLCIYSCWIIYTLLGVWLASAVPNLENYHLNFSIVATFAAIVVPMIKRLSTLVGVVVSLALSLVLNSLGISGAMVISGLLGMACAVVAARLGGEGQQ